uniref:Tetraspanin n=1 Tax=Plectus sambesii TaxID=2011161 RepID=A0A914ULT0_9BILA
MVYGCGNSVIKFLVFALNLLICLGGAVILGVSLWANLDKNFSSNIGEFIEKTKLPSDYADLGKYQASLWVLVGVGALLFLVGFLGCCGAACENTLLLTLFFIIVLILAVIELGAAIFAVTNKDDFYNKIDNVLEKGYEQDKTQFVIIQDAFTCCGTPKHPEGYNCTTTQQEAQ